MSASQAPPTSSQVEPATTESTAETLTTTLPPLSEPQSSEAPPTLTTATIPSSSTDTLSLPSSTSSSGSIIQTTSSATSGASSPSAAASPSASTTQSASPTQLSAGSIAGIAVGSIVALILAVAILLFALGFRVRRGKWSGRAEATGDQSAAQAAGGKSPGGDQQRKAELEDSEYTRRLERLHDGAKPELEGGWLRRAGRRAFSARSAKSQPRPAPAELGTRPVTGGPYELPAGDSVPSGNAPCAQGSSEER